MSSMQVQNAQQKALQKQGLGLFVLNEQEKEIANKHYRRLGDKPTPAQIELFELDKDMFAWSRYFFDKLPPRGAEYFRKLYARQYKRHLKGETIAHQVGNIARKEANKYLKDVLMPRVDKVLAQYTHLVAITDPARVFFYLETLQKPSGKNAYVNSHRKPLYLYTRKEIEQLFAMPLASYFEQVIEDFGQAHQGKVEDDEQMFEFFKLLYKKCGVFCENLLLDLPHWKTFNKGNIKLTHIESDLAKACCFKYWNKRLHKAKVRMAEHIAIATGQVNKFSSAYVSQQAFDEFKTQQKKNFDFIKNQILINLDDPDEQVELLYTYVRSNANPKIRRIEMMNRLRGVEEWAESQGDVALFLTLTAPSSFHAYHSKGGFNAKWQGDCPKATQQYLCATWAKMRAAWSRQAIHYYGMRVVEPHHDATPHWHLLVYLKPEKVDKFTEIFKRYALEVDGDEKGAKLHRCKIEHCDPDKGTPTGYIAKYIAKNIDGYALQGEVDNETGKPLQETSSKATAWACLWNIRQFQMFGQPPITVWRELRRLGNQVISHDDKLENMRIVCDVGDFACYIREQGGTELSRSELLARVNYEEMGLNDYLEKRTKVTGIYNQQALTSKVVITRLKRWATQRKPANWQELKEAQDEMKISDRRSPWTCVNNCTVQNSDNMAISPIIFDDEQDLKMNKGKFLRNLDKNREKLHRLGINLTAEQQITLLIGGRVRMNDGISLSFNDGKLRFLV